MLPVQAEVGLGWSASEDNVESLIPTPTILTFPAEDTTIKVKLTLKVASNGCFLSQKWGGKSLFK